ncbi:hypothetical protein A2U94_14265 [Bacillus sp. VT 712]|nr:MULTISPECIES: DUF6123 family protein [Bacillaceae]KZB90751.1 hypothetical protein A2U94_14265 [Bacillus sp. VT 712]
MTKMVNSLEEYLLYLEEKGFSLKEDAKGFIAFGQQYTKMPDEMVIFSVEWTLKMQKEFDGSFFVALLEQLAAQKVKTRKQAMQVLKQTGMI